MLISRQKHPSESTENIIVYKHFVIKDSGIFTPAQEYNCTNEIFRGVFKAVESEYHRGPQIYPISDYSWGYDITDGYIHAYTETSRVVHECVYCNDVVIKCIIPPGSEILSKL